MKKLTHQEICASCAGSEGKIVCEDGASFLALFLLGKPYIIHSKCKRALEHLTIETGDKQRDIFEDYSV